MACPLPTLLGPLKTVTVLPAYGKHQQGKVVPVTRSNLLLRTAQPTCTRVAMQPSTAAKERLFRP